MDQLLVLHFLFVNNMVIFIYFTIKISVRANANYISNLWDKDKLILHRCSQNNLFGEKSKQLNYVFVYIFFVLFLDENL